MEPKVIAFRPRNPAKAAFMAAYRRTLLGDPRVLLLSHQPAQLELPLGDR